MNRYTGTHSLKRLPARAGIPENSLTETEIHP